ncbi:MAG TPA: DUF4412 domain-containing protein [Peptococcaceae bacterium]|nr:DUF4412 domain-containing protein [Peptococcaceae bacterium]
MMKKTSNKCFLLIIMILIGTLVLSGCVGKKTEITPNPPENSSPADSPPAAGNDPQPEKTNTPTEQEIISGLIAKGQEIKEMSYDLVMIGAGLSAESKVFLKEKKMKIDSVFNGQRMISILDFDQGELLTYLPGDPVATKMKITEYQGQDHITPLDYLHELEKADFRPAGTETVNGMECKAVTVISPEGSYKMWLSTQYGIVVKVEGGPDVQGVIEYKNIQVGPGTVAEDTFELPPGMEILDIEEMFQQNELPPNEV